MAQGVAALLRYVHSTAQRLPIFDEMSAIQRYTQVMNIRFCGKFTVDFDVDDRLSDYMMPRMLLQPLVENAMMHGLEAKEAPCLLEIRGRMEEGAVVLCVWDNGVGIPREKLRMFARRMEEDIDAYEYLNIKGISLINIHKRIRAAFGPEYGLEIESTEGAYTLATIRIPKIGIHEQEGGNAPPPLGF
jgi:two-component system sensor histidine kinase YesM